jgi:peptidylprolyl isomerase
MHHSILGSSRRAPVQRRSPLRSRAVALAVTPVLAVALGLGLASCGSSANSASPPPSTTSTTTTASTQPAAEAPTNASGAIAPIPPSQQSPAGTFGKAPTVTVPAGTPPKELQSADLITGTGATAAAGDALTVQYVLATYSSGKVVQSSWTSQPFTFTLGVGDVIPGWDKGVVGMQAGGRRELIIPPALGYGKSSPGPGIAADDTLVFVIDLISIKAE